MNDPTEGIERAARKIFEYDAPSQAPEEWEPLNEWAKVDYRHTAVAAITAYLEHAFPEVTSAEELDALPVGVIVLLRDGDIWRRFADGWWCEGGPGIKAPIWYAHDFPARVIHWGDHA